VDAGDDYAPVLWLSGDRSRLLRPQRSTFYLACIDPVS
jgi:hypothetical protein